MSIVGIIAEFNPLHTGHRYLINEAKKLGNVVCVISGNFVQRGDTAIVEKHIRTKAALSCGADLVLELPVCWSMSTAQNFAIGGVAQLYGIGCDTLMFGSECGDTQLLTKACDILTSKEFSEKLSKILDSGITFAAARELAAKECGLKDGVLSGANNNLAIEYMLASRVIGANMQFRTIKRMGALHDASKAEGNYASASLIRERLLEGNYAFAKKYIPENIIDLFGSDDISDIKRIETAILAVLRTKTMNQLSTLPDLSEGLENKLYSSIKLATSLEELYNTLKVKRYTHARIRRLVLSAFIGIDNSLFLQKPPYIRVLGFNRAGEDILKSNVSDSPVPVILRAGEIKQLDDISQRVFEWEARATDLYLLSLLSPQPCGLEYTAKLIKMEC